MVSNKNSRKDVSISPLYVRKTVNRHRQKKVDVKKAVYELLLGLKRRLICYKNHANHQVVSFLRTTFRQSHPHQFLFERLPCEMLLMILQNLPLDALRSLACASKYLCCILQHYYLSQAFRRRFDIFVVADFGTFLVKSFIDKC